MNCWPFGDRGTGLQVVFVFGLGFRILFLFGFAFGFGLEFELGFSGLSPRLLN